MSGFIATGTNATEHKIENDAFWPDIDCLDLRAAMRLDASVTPERIEAAAINAMIEANRELDLYRRARQEEGHASLADVPAPQIKGESQLLHLYRRTIYCRATAELVERYRSFDATNSGEQRADEDSTNIDELRRDARHALRTILGVSHTTVELL